MKLYLFGHDYRYAVEQSLLTLFPDQRPEYPDTDPSADDDAAWSTLQMPQEGQENISASACIQYQGRTSTAFSWCPVTELTGGLVNDRVLQRLIKQSFYKATVQLTGKYLPWGMLTGIRPAKLASRALEAGMSLEEVHTLFWDTYFVSQSRTELALDAAQAGLAVKRSLKPDEISLYIGIPFCPTRCAYCSFVSADVQKALKLVEPYLDGLCREMAASAEYLRQAGLYIRTIYIGGGTPTTLTAPQLERLLTQVETCFDLSRLTEYTVEAGRPDTITADKMAVLMAHHVDRVSVNPQSMEDTVLEAMGRSHTAADILDAYAIVRQAGIPMVNMDLIAGLPKDSLEGFQYTLEQVLELAPENITVHTLALKKGSRLAMERQGLPSGAETAAMLEYAWKRLWEAGYLPYYLYRQKYMSGALENIGWCKPGCEGIYNICIMEELHTILALGGGGSTKLTDPATGKIVRITNPKYPHVYLERVEQVCQNKAELVPFHLALRRRAEETT